MSSSGSRATTTAAAITTTTASANITPSQNKVHGALILVQVLFGIVCVVAALGLPATNPLTFALYREVFAGLLLLWASIIYSNENIGKVVSFTTATTTSSSLIKTSTNYDYPSWIVPIIRHYKTFAFLGLTMFGNQAGFIVGVKLAGPIVASVWQPSQPLITSALSMTMGLEAFNRRRLFGIIIAFIGCGGMVLLSIQAKKQQQEETQILYYNTTITKATTTLTNDNDSTTATTIRYLVGNVLFLIQDSCVAMYVIYSKKMLKIYPSLTVTAWSYMMAACFMILTVLLSTVLSSFMPINEFLCPECTNNILYLPKEAIPALLYYIIFASAIAYGLMTWANQHVTGTLVLGYCVLQPVTAVLLTATVIAFGVVPSCAATTINTSLAEDVLETEGIDSTTFCLDPPSISTVFGMIGIFSGLAIIILTEPTDITKTTKRLKVRHSSIIEEDDDIDEEGLEAVPLVQTIQSNEYNSTT